MRRYFLGTILLILTATLGGFFAAMINAYSSFSQLQTTVKVRWQDKHQPCGEPHRIFANQEPVVSDNPLCEYSADLAEIPTVTHRELADAPSRYDRKIVRVKGRFVSNLNNPFKSQLHAVDGDLPAIGAGYWSLDDSEELCNFIDTKGAETNSADVTLIIQFIDASDAPSAVAFNGGSPLMMILLAVEEMQSVPQISTGIEPAHRQHEKGSCWNNANHSFSIYD